MKSDQYFEIGASHEICQDYAISGEIDQDNHYAIVTDGCTMSHEECNQVDIGARVIAHSAKKVIKSIYNDNHYVRDNTNSMGRAIGNESIAITRGIESQLRLLDSSSDCTLLAAIANKNGEAYSFMFGDGLVWVRHRDETVTIVDVSFLSGAPLYLSYQTDKCRKQGYMQQFGFYPVFVDFYNFDFEGELIKKDSFQYDVKDDDLYDHFMMKWDNVDCIAVSSDGAKSFSKKENGNDTPISLRDIMFEFNQFKNRNGVFVQRRLKSMGRTHEKNLITHYDDISSAAIITT